MTTKTESYQYPKLPIDFKTQWISALRSGTYKQSKKKLYSIATNGYCCLGVACRITDKNIDLNNRNLITKDMKLDIPEILVYPQVTDNTNNLITKLTKMNDKDNKSFSEIADWIEENL